MQKKVLALHDLAGLGRSSLVPIIAVLSAMGHQCVPVPTACYSSHLALSGWQGCDLTGQMRPALAQYAGLGLRFDAAYAGFLSSSKSVLSRKRRGWRIYWLSTRCWGTTGGFTAA